jgi:integrase
MILNWEDRGGQTAGECAHQNAECRKSYRFANQRFFKRPARNEFSGQNRAEVYSWVEKMLVEQEYQPRSGVRSQGETDFTVRDLRRLRPGEILALRWKTLESDAIRVEERIHKRALNTTRNGKTREGAISDGTLALIKE